MLITPNTPRILYAGNLDPYGTCYSRLLALRDLNQDVVEFDTYSFVQDIAKTARWKRDLRSLQVRAEINHKLLETSRTHQPDILWLDTGEWISSWAIKKLRNDGLFLTRHTTDALYPRKPLRLRFRRHWLRRAMTDFDLIYTSNERDYARLFSQHGEKFQLTDLGYDHRRFHTGPVSDELRCRFSNDVVFVGHHEERTERAVLALIDAGVNVTVYGHGPWFRSKNRNRLGDHLKPRLNNQDYEASLKCAKIGLCCISEWNYNQTAARSFEIPASGSFLLAMRTDRHKQFYTEGVEAEFFDGHAELVNKAKYYLAHDKEREQIAAAGSQRAISSGYSWNAIMKRDLQKLQSSYAAWIEKKQSVSR